MFESFCFDSKLVLLNVSLHVHVDAYCDITLGYHVKRECSSPTLQHSGVVEGGEIFIDFIRILKFLYGGRLAVGTGDLDCFTIAGPGRCCATQGDLDG